DGAGVEMAMLALAGLVALAAGAVWAGAAVAVALGGHGGLGAGFGDAMRAIPSLLAHAGSPGRAWPAPVSARVPGPVLYWACTAPVLVAALAAAPAAAVLVGRRRPAGLERRSRMGLDPEARFARARDLAPLWVNRP